MRADATLAGLLYRVIDNYTGQIRTIHLFHTSAWDVTEIELRPNTLTQVFDGDELCIPQVQVLARIEGRVKERQFLALLQMQRSGPDVTDIAWHVDHPDRIKQWLTLYHLKGKPGLVPEPVRTPMSVPIEHCWAWDTMHLVHSTGTTDIADFTEFMNREIPEAVIPFLFGRTVLCGKSAEKLKIENGDGVVVWGVPALSNLFPASLDHIYGSLRNLPGAMRYRVIDVPSFMAVNWHTLLSLRLQGTNVHCYHDDETLGCLPVTEEIRPHLETAKDRLKDFLANRWGDQLTPLMNRLNWNPWSDLHFPETVQQHDTWKQPTGRITPPSLGWFLPI